MLGDGQVPRIEVPNLDGLEEYLAKLGLTLHQGLRFVDAYHRNCEVRRSKPEVNAQD